MSQSDHRLFYIHRTLDRQNAHTVAHGYDFSTEKPKKGYGLRPIFITERGYLTDEQRKQAASQLGNDLDEVNVSTFIDIWTSQKHVPESSEIDAIIPILTLLCDDAKEKDITKMSMVFAGIEAPSKDFQHQIETLLAPYDITLVWLGVTVTLGERLSDKLLHHFDSLRHRAHMDVKHDRPAGNLRHTDPTGYWNPKVEINPMFAHSQWYFNTHAETAPLSRCGRHIYYLGKHGKQTEDAFLGSSNSDFEFSIIYLKEPQLVLEAVRKHQEALDPRERFGLAIGRLAAIFKPLNYHEILTYGDQYLEPHVHHMDLYSPQNDQLTRQLRPVGRAYDLIEQMGELGRILDEFIDDPVKHNVCVTDLSPHLFDEVTKGKKVVTVIKPTITSALRSIDVPVTFNTKVSSGTTKVTLNLGQDMPHRNALARLAPDVTRCVVVTWRLSETFIRYATIVETANDIGIWSGLYNNLHSIGPL